MSLKFIKQQAQPYENINDTKKAVSKIIEEVMEIITTETKQTDVKISDKTKEILKKCQVINQRSYELQ